MRNRPIRDERTEAWGSGGHAGATPAEAKLLAGALAALAFATIAALLAGV